MFDIKVFNVTENKRLTEGIVEVRLAREREPTRMVDMP